MFLSALFLFLVSGPPGCVASPTTRTGELTLDDGSAFEVRVDRPARPNGAGVLLLGGGYGHDCDWSVPGEVEHQGERVRLTINGEAHADAPVITRSLVAGGFVVVRTSTVPVGADEATMVPFFPNLEIARKGLRTLRSEVDVNRVYIVGHSLGATRAALVADDQVGGIVALAGAYLARASESPKALGERAAGSAAAMESAEDLDGDGVIRGWEAAAGVLVESDDEEFFHGQPWPIDRLRELGTPVLAIFGGLDPISLSGPSLARLANAEVVYVQGVGHNLGDEEAAEPWGRTGPIKATIVEKLTAWLVRLDANRRGGS